MKFYIIPAGTKGYDTLDAVSAAIKDTKDIIVIKGAAFTPKPQLVLLPLGAATRAPRKEPPLPAEDVLAAVTALYADGKGHSKIKAREALSTLGVDVVDGCIDWMAHTGRLTVAGKTYTAAVQP
mgnify:FL=1